MESTCFPILSWLVVHYQRHYKDKTFFRIHQIKLDLFLFYFWTKIFGSLKYYCYLSIVVNH